MRAERPRPGSYVLREIETLSRDTVAFTGGNFSAGEVVAEIAGKMVKLDFSASDGSEIPSAISFGYVDAATEELEGVATARLTSVIKDQVLWPETATDEQIEAAKKDLLKKYSIKII